MARPGITLADVQQAVAELEREGQSVTQVAVRRALGDTGSMSTIRAHLETLRQARARERGDRRELPGEMAEAITQALAGLWEHAQAQARADVDAIRYAAQERSERLSRELDELSAAYDEQIDELNRARSVLKEMTEELHAAKNALTIASAEKTELRRSYDALLVRLEPQSEAVSVSADQLELDLQKHRVVPRSRRRNAKQE